MYNWNDVIIMSDTMFRNTFPQPTKLKWLSSILSQVLQLKFSREVTIAYMDINKGIQDYELPDDCEPDDIISFQVETGTDSNVYIPYEYQDVNELTSGRFYTLINGMIHFHDKPSEDKLSLLYYIGTPELTEDDLSNKVPLPSAYQELMVHGLCERMAAARGDVVRKNNFKADFDTLLSDYLMAQMNNAPEYPVPKDELPRRSRRGRRMEATNL